MSKEYQQDRFKPDLALQQLTFQKVKTKTWLDKWASDGGRNYVLFISFYYLEIRKHTFPNAVTQWPGAFCYYLQLLLPINSCV